MGDVRLCVCPECGGAAQYTIKSGFGARCSFCGWYIGCLTRRTEDFCDMNNHVEYVSPYYRCSGKGTGMTYGMHSGRSGVHSSLNSDEVLLQIAKLPDKSYVVTDYMGDTYYGMRHVSKNVDWSNCTALLEGLFRPFHMGIKYGGFVFSGDLDDEIDVFLNSFFDDLLNYVPKSEKDYDEFCKAVCDVASDNDDDYGTLAHTAELFGLWPLLPSKSNKIPYSSLKVPRMHLVYLPNAKGGDDTADNNFSGYADMNNDIIEAEGLFGTTDLIVSDLIYDAFKQFEIYKDRPLKSHGVPDGADAFGENVYSVDFINSLDNDTLSLNVKQLILSNIKHIMTDHYNAIDGVVVSNNFQHYPKMDLAEAEVWTKAPSAVYRCDNADVRKLMYCKCPSCGCIAEARVSVSSHDYFCDKCGFSITKTKYKNTRYKRNGAYIDIDGYYRSKRVGTGVCVYAVDGGYDEFSGSYWTGCDVTYVTEPRDVDARKHKDDVLVCETWFEDGILVIKSTSDYLHRAFKDFTIWEDDNHNQWLVYTGDAITLLEYDEPFFENLMNTDPRYVALEMTQAEMTDEKFLLDIDTKFAKYSAYMDSTIGELVYHRPIGQLFEFCGGDSDIYLDYLYGYWKTYDFTRVKASDSDSDEEVCGLVSPTIDDILADKYCFKVRVKIIEM